VIEGNICHSYVHYDILRPTAIHCNVAYGRVTKIRSTSNFSVSAWTGRGEPGNNRITDTNENGGGVRLRSQNRTFAWSIHIGN